jgi:hypothetical protein
MGPTAGDKVTTEAGYAAVPTTVLPTEPERPPVAPNVVPGEYLSLLNIFGPQPAVYLLSREVKIMT